MALIATIIVFIVAAQIFMLLENTQKLEVARAGRVDKPTNRFKYMKINKSKDVTDLKPFAVSGESMKDFEIHDGNVVYVSLFNSLDEKKAIKTHPVLMFTIYNMKKSESRYKLRKFVDYVKDIQQEDWGVFYEMHKERLVNNISKEDFICMCKQKVSKIMKCNESCTNENKGQYILSETFEGNYRYSLHPVESLYGKVCYAS